MLDRNREYHPICKKKSLDCGGDKKEGCTVDGKYGTICPPTDEALLQAKNDEKM